MLSLLKLLNVFGASERVPNSCVLTVSA